MRLWNDRHLRLAITRLGLQFLGLTLAMGLFAVNTGNNLLYALFALLLSLFLVSGWVSLKALKGITLDRIEFGNLFARVKGGIRVYLADRHPGRPRGLEVQLHLEGSTPEPGFYPGGGKEGGRVALQVVPDCRGWRRLHELELRTRFPFGFMEKTLRIPLNETFLVLPHPRAARHGSGGDGQEPCAVPRPGATSPQGIRPFRVGDNPRRVHWKRTAQRGEPWVRTMEDEQPFGIRVELDLLQWKPGSPFESELERLCGVILQARIHRQPVTLVLMGLHGRRTLTGVVPAWRSLALAEPQGEDAPAS